MDNDFLLSHKEKFLGFAPKISNYIDLFRQINRRWRGAITSGMIETGRMKKEAARLFEPLIQDMRSTITNYEQIQTRLVNAILIEMVKKVVFEVSDAAGFTINILKRNLFERTADVGYLATDGEIVRFLKAAKERGDDEAMAGRVEEIRSRLGEYQHEYTVYNEIIILDLKGRVLANLDPENPIRESSDPLLADTQAVDLHSDTEEDQYIETFRPTDLMPGHGNVLVYSQKIEDPETGTPLGTLCLCFDFEDEMERIFKDLNQGNENIIAAILDHEGRVVSTSQPRILGLSTKIPLDPKADFTFLSLDNREYLISTVPTDGYQGFYGLTWYGMAMIETGQAFAEEQGGPRFDMEVIRQVQNFSKELSAIKKESDNLLSDMKIDGLNGIVQAGKFRDKTFIEILHFVEEIGRDIDTLFNSAIGNLQQTVVTALFNDVQFRAFQGNNIADRNLYERANDVCWWALTPLFRKSLARHRDKGLEEKDKTALKENLQYINDLYTPYLRLVLVDPAGLVIAASDPPDELEERFIRDGMPKGQEFIGMSLDAGLVDSAVSLVSSQDYVVSEFAPTPLYGGRHTYIYATAVRDPENMKKVVGAILIVFDSDPQFRAMLSDILPKDENKKIISGSFGIFADKQKTILSSTHPGYHIGSKIPLGDEYFNHEKGERDAAIVTLGEQSYAMGFQVSEGYREYKLRDGYANDVICMIFIPI
ncbi:cache domain-containing protein [Desulfospira joergensenii]|uniref:cache domain-containing protein n=1 Tax=Desulfospira joergensenii TaxID=53329 RepID=UPI0003B4DAFC|nr:cache domain-containing protein [Desulfospira joergensenii]